MSLRVIKIKLKEIAKLIELCGVLDLDMYIKYYQAQKEFNKLTRRQQKRIIYKAQAYIFIREVTDKLIIKEKVKNDRPSN